MLRLLFGWIAVLSLLAGTTAIADLDVNIGNSNETNIRVVPDNPLPDFKVKKLRFVKSIIVDKCSSPGTCQPYALDFDNQGNLYVTDPVNTVMVYDKNGKFIKSWDMKEVSDTYLRAIMIDKSSSKGKIYLTSQYSKHTDTIFVYSKEDGIPTKKNIKFPGFAHYFLQRLDGSLIVSDNRDSELEVYQFGKGFFIPTTSGTVITDEDNPNLEVVVPQFKHLATWKLKGTNVKPRQLSLHLKTGNIYVAARNENEIQIYDSKGKFLKSFNGTGLNIPHGVIVDNLNNVVFVADTGNDRLVEFTLDGQFIRNYDFKDVIKPKFSGPRFMKFGPDGYLYLTNYYDGKVNVFEYK